MGEEEIIALRTAKLERLRSRGIDPYPARFRPSHTAQQAIELLGDRGGTSNPVTVAGRITAMRQMGKATFIDLRDGSGRIQIYVKEDVVGAQAYETLRDIDLGDFLGVGGPLFRTKTGEPTGGSSPALASAARCGASWTGGASWRWRRRCSRPAPAAPPPALSSPTITLSTASSTCASPWSSTSTGSSSAATRAS